MKVVLDSNVFVSCLNSFSPYHKIFEALANGDFQLLISTDIFFEYSEVFSNKFIRSKADIFFHFIENSEDVTEVKIYYYWNLITIDPDDNKFVDCAIAANADYIVTDDKHFNILHQINFPKVVCITVNEFMEILKQQFLTPPTT